MLNLSLTFLTLKETVCSRFKSIAVNHFEASTLIPNSHNLFCLHFYFFFSIFSLSCLTKNLPLWGTMKRLLASLGCKADRQTVKKRKKIQQHAAYNPIFFLFTCTKRWINWWISLDSSTNVHGLNPCYYMQKTPPFFEDSLICNHKNFNSQISHNTATTSPTEKLLLIHFFFLKKRRLVC